MKREKMNEHPISMPTDFEYPNDSSWTNISKNRNGILSREREKNTNKCQAAVAAATAAAHTNVYPPIWIVKKCAEHKVVLLRNEIQPCSAHFLTCLYTEGDGCVVISVLANLTSTQYA